MAELHLPGFGLAGYRSFGGQHIEKMGPMGPVHLLAGPNNSGKSNVLAMLDKGLSSLREGPGLELQLLDSPAAAQGDDSRRLRLAVLWPVSDESLAQITGLHSQDVDRLKQAISGETFMASDGGERRWFEFELDAGHGWTLTGEQITDMLNSPSAGGMGALSRRLTSAEGGEQGANEARVLKVITDSLSIRESLPSVELIGAFRQIGPEGQGVLGQHSGPGLIERLAALQHPGAEAPQDRERFAQIEEFVRTLFDDASAGIEIPHDHDYILIHYRGQRLPLEHYGTGLHEVVILASAATVLTASLVCIEEPEIHLHPTLQRKLLAYLAEQTDNQYVIATHSAHLLDTAKASITAVTVADGNSELSPVIEPREVALISRALGARASDVVQSNAIIWVEGPSDRIYVQGWIGALDTELLEGVHYSLVFYGGRLLKYLSPNDPAIDELVNLPRINQNFAVVLDSDRKTAHQHLNPTQRRIRDEVRAVAGADSVWITRGYTIENYVPPQLLKEAVAAAHPMAQAIWNGDQYTNPFDRIRQRTSPVDKTLVARHVIERWKESTEWRLDLKRRVRGLIAMVREANDLALD